MSENIFTVHNHFRQVLGPVGQVVLAGGAVRDSLRNQEPKDYDIFVLPWQLDTEWHRNEGRKFIVKDLLKDYKKNQPILTHDYEPYLVADLTWHDVRVQVMLNPAQSMYSLVETFDWKICKFAWNGSAMYLEFDPNEVIVPGAELELNTVRFPASTLRRGFRFSERFGMSLPQSTILELCRLTIEKASNWTGPQGANPDMPSLEANTLVD